MTSRQEANISRFIDCSEVQMAGSSGPLCRVMADPLESQGIVKFLQRTMCTARVANPKRASSHVSNRSPGAR